MNFKQLLTCLLILQCTAQTVTARPAQDLSRIWRDFAGRLEAGAFVEVRLKDRTRVQGQFVEANEERFTINPKTRIPVPLRSFQFGEIDSIERRNRGWSPGAKVVTGTFATIGGLLILAFAAIAASYD